MTEHNEHKTFRADEIPSQEISDPAVLSNDPLVSVPIMNPTLLRQLRVY